MTRSAMAEFFAAIEREEAVARGVADALEQCEDGTVVWAVARYARSRGFAVTVEDVRRERGRRDRMTAGAAPAVSERPAPERRPRLIWLR